MNRYAIGAVCAFLVVLGLCAGARSHDGGHAWRPASSAELSAAWGGQDVVCQVKCANPNACPGGGRFSCKNIVCAGPGACPTGQGVDNPPFNWCPACDQAAAGKHDCNGSGTFYCSYNVTCGSCSFYGNPATGQWLCTNTSSVGIGNPVTDVSPSGAACP